MTRSSLSKHPLPVIDALRVAAVFWILLFHLCSGVAFFQYGYLGVDLLFALSGFLVEYHYADTLVPFNPVSYKKFLSARLARLYPLHIFTLLIIAGLVYGASWFGYAINNPDDYTLGSFIAHVFLVSAWQFPSEMTWNHYAWAISALWMMYLLSPIFLRFVMHLRGPLELMCVGVILVALTPIIRMHWPYESFVAYAIPRAFNGFGIGLLTWRWFSMMQSPRFSFPSNSVVTWLAKISYAIYMMQFPVIMVTRKIFPTNVDADFYWLTIAAQIIIILILAAIAHTAIEEPMRRWLRRAKF